MKKLLFGFLALGLITATSCKKDDDNPSCESTVAGIANTFKISKGTAESSIGGGEVDIPLSDCTKSGVYTLKSDKSATYVESGSSCNTTTETGTWDVVNGKVTINVGSLILDDLSIYTWDCTNFTIGFAQSAGGFTTTQKYYFVKQ